MTPSPTRILIVDDEPILREMAELAFEQKGFECDSAADGIEALQRIGERSYDVVVTDLLMPRMNGGELVIRLCNLPSAPIVIVHTSVLEPEVIRGLKSEGVAEVVSKPANYSEIAGTIQALLERQRSSMGRSIRRTSGICTFTSMRSNPFIQMFGRTDEWIQRTTSRRESFRFTILLLACFLFGLGWGESLSSHVAILCKLFSLCGVAFYLALELVAYYRDKNREMLQRHVAERRLSREWHLGNECASGRVAHPGHQDGRSVQFARHALR